MKKLKMTCHSWIHRHGIYNFDINLILIQVICSSHSPSIGSSSRCSSVQPPLRSSSVQPPQKRKRRYQSDEDDVIGRHLARLEERRAEREDRRAEKQREAQLNEDDVFGKQVASIMKRFDRAKSPWHDFKFCNYFIILNFHHQHNPN